MISRNALSIVSAATVETVRSADAGFMLAIDVLLFEVADLHSRRHREFSTSFSARDRRGPTAIDSASIGGGYRRVASAPFAPISACARPRSMHRRALAKSTRETHMIAAVPVPSRRTRVN